MCSFPAMSQLSPALICCKLGWSFRCFLLYQKWGGVAQQQFCERQNCCCVPRCDQPRPPPIMVYRAISRSEHVSLLSSSRSTLLFNFSFRFSRSIVFVRFKYLPSSFATASGAARVVTSLNCCPCEQFDLRVSLTAEYFFCCRPFVPSVHCGLVGFVYFSLLYFSFRALHCTCALLFCGHQQFTRPRP